MKILLLGEASNLHWTLAEGLRSLGHQVTVASNGSHWMDNSRDIKPHTQKQRHYRLRKISFQSIISL